MLESVRSIPSQSVSTTAIKDKSIEPVALSEALKRQLESIFEGNFLCAEKEYQRHLCELISLEQFFHARAEFTQKWLKRHFRVSLDIEQASAVGSIGNHTQVIARAGSGKTTTLVNRTLFLLKHCNVSPHEIILLAFNRKAALEIRRRLLALLSDGAEAAIVADIDRRVREAGKKNRIDWEGIESSAVESIATQRNVTLPHVMTFHALAYAVVHPEENLLYNGSDGEAQGLSRVFQQVIDDHLQNPAFKEDIRELMLAHFREDWDRIVEGCYDQSKEELLRFRRSLPRECLGGEYVKSYGEKVIADFLFEHDIAYKYERNHWWGSINYRPDFTVFQSPNSGTIIEYFGLQGDSDYDEMSDRKRDYWAKKADWKLIEYSPADIASEGVDSFLKVLKSDLEERGISCIRLSEDEIWHRVRDRAIDRFTTAMVGFIGKCRKRLLPPSELQHLIDGYSPISVIEKMFLKLALCLYEGYLARLVATGDEDFDGLIQRAICAVDSGQTLFSRKVENGDLLSLRHICIDEFQDFSDLFYRFLDVIRKQNPSVELFCVGDDWQAINGFAGADLKYFESFTDYFSASRRLYISTNYRSNRAIVAIGNALMEGLGKPAIAYKQAAGAVQLADINKFEPSLLEKQRHPGDVITPAVLRIISKSLADGLDVVILCRRNAVPWFVNFQDKDGVSGRGLARYLDLVQSYFPKGLKERISISTSHKYKGLEKQTVILLDAIARSYPLIHPDWAFARILGDTPEKITREERRLFYVTLTRAVEKLVVITDGKNKSPFLQELEQDPSALRVLNWIEYPPVRGKTARLLVTIGNQEHQGGAPTFAIKDLLKAAGYQWQSKNWPGWAKSFPSEGFRIEIIQRELWAQSANGIEVRVLDDTDGLVARYLVDSGRWQCLTDHLVLFAT